MHTRTCRNRWLQCFVAGVVGLFVTDAAFSQENKVVRGTLVGTQGNLMQVKQSDGTQVDVAVSPRTEYRVSAKGPRSLLKEGAWVRVEGHIEQGQTAVEARGLSLVLTQRPERPVKGILQPGDKAVSVDFYGTIKSLDPLRVVADQGAGILTNTPGQAGVGSIDIGGETIEVNHKGDEITLDFGDNLEMAGKEPEVQAHLYDQQSGAATSVWVTRVEPLDLDKLQPKKKARKRR